MKYPVAASIPTVVEDASSAHRAPPSAPSAPRSPTRVVAALLGFLRAHPVVSLALLTPGIVEYLSTSSPVLVLFESPVAFLLFLAVNVGQYTAGALLVREALVRWGKGWATAGFLGLAYGITEEGLGDNTLFRSSDHADGVLGWYGHFLGVNWVWSFAVLVLHVVVSLTLPIVVLGLALPQTRGKPLLGRWGVLACIATLVASTLFESVTVLRLFGFWMGWDLFAGCLVAIVALIVAGYLVPRGVWAPAPDRPTASPRAMFLAGFALLPVLLVTEYGSAALGIPPVLALFAEGGFLVLYLEWVRRHIGSRAHPRLRLELAFGLVVFEAAFGVLINLSFPYSLPLAALAVYFFLRLRRSYPGEGPTIGALDRSAVGG